MAIKMVGKCSNCGAKINVDEENEKAFCPYCGSEFVIDNSGKTFSANMFSYLNKAGKRRQEELRRKEEAKEREAIRKAEEKKRSLYVSLAVVAVAFGALILLWVFEGDDSDSAMNAPPAEQSVNNSDIDLDIEEAEVSMLSDNETTMSNTEVSSVEQKTTKDSASISKSIYTIELYEEGEYPFEYNAKYSMLQNFYLYMENPNVSSIDELAEQAEKCGLNVSYGIPKSDDNENYSASCDMTISGKGGKITTEFYKTKSEGLSLSGQRYNMYAISRHTYRPKGSVYVAEYYPTSSEMGYQYCVKDDEHPLKNDRINYNSLSDAIDKIIEITE